MAKRGDPSTAGAAGPFFRYRAPMQRQRYDGLDVVRALAMLLGIAYHAGYAYVPGIGPWYVVQDVSTAPAFDVLVKVLHAFRMQLFFVLSGFFAHLVAERRDFLRDRFRRLMVPFLVAAPLAVALDAALRGWSRAQGTLQAPDGWLARPLHLWFLEYLFLFCLLAAAAKRVPGRGLAALTARALQAPEALAALALLTGAALRWLPEAKPSDSFVPQLATVALYLPFFALGWLLWGAREHLPRLRRLAWLGLPGLALAGWLFSRHLQWEPEGAWVCAAASWLLVLGGLGLAVRVPPSVRGAALASAVEASYWVYLVHYPLVVAGHLALAKLPWPAWLKYALVVGAVSALAFASWAWVRRTPLRGWLGVRARPTETS